MYLALVGHTSNLTTNYYAGSLWKSVNGGKDWQHINNITYAYGSMPGDPRYKTAEGSIMSSLAISSNNPNKIYMIGIESRLYKSLNGGANWTDITPAAISPSRISINPHDAENMYLVNGQGNPLETTDGGSTWHELKYDLALLDTGSFGYGEDKGRRWSWITFFTPMCPNGCWELLIRGTLSPATTAANPGKIFPSSRKNIATVRACFPNRDKVTRLPQSKP